MTEKKKKSGARDLKVRVKKARTVGSEGRHLKLMVEDEREVVHDAIGFRLGHLGADLPPRVDLIYRFEINEFKGRTSFQLNLLDLKPSGTPD